MRLSGQLLASWLGVVVALAAPAFAEDAPRRVGSLNYLSGEVSYVLHAEPGEPSGSDAENWLQADFDQPVCQDMSLKTGALARARVRIGPDAIQMSGDTWLNMLNLTDQLIEASIRYGRIYLQLSKLEPGESVELEMPRGSLWLLQPGAYDIETGAGDEPTRIVVFEGKARFVGGAADLPIAAGKQVQLTGNYPSITANESDWTGINPTEPAPAGLASAATSRQASPSHEPSGSAAAGEAPAPAPGDAAPGDTALMAKDQSAAASGAVSAASAGKRSPDAARPATAEAAVPSSKSRTVTANLRNKPADEFLLWVEQSDQDQQQPDRPSARYVSADTTGADALDRYGRWDTLPDSEPVWFPTSVADDWAPYRFGHWDRIEPWGLTWVDDQPWGFAPFHYGRWVNVDGRWGWVPGAVEPHPVYAPALVAFIDAPDNSGGDPNGGPDVGWFPLAPGDDYAPWYQAGPDYVESVNAPEHGHFHDGGQHRLDERGRELGHAEHFNRRFATMVSREAFADGRHIDRGMMRQVSADRLEHAEIMHGAPHIMPAVMRSPAGAGRISRRSTGRTTGRDAGGSGGRRSACAAGCGNPA